jgi:hypothetical protein
MWWHSLGMWWLSWLNTTEQTPNRNTAVLGSMLGHPLPFLERLQKQ